MSEAAVAPTGRGPEERAAFELEGVSYRYASRGPLAAREVSLRIPRGDFVAIVGPNGAGKSTVARLMLGLLKPETGRALVDGDDAESLDPKARARRAAYVPQSARVFFPYRAEEIVATGRLPHARPLSGPSADDERAVLRAMRATGVEPLARRRYDRLSGGEAQRVLLARALAQEAPSLVFDEPTSSLDLHYQTALYEILAEANREAGATVVVVTHDVNAAAERCRRLVGVRGGRIVADAAPEEFLTAERMRELYDVEAEVERLADGTKIVRARRAIAR